VIIDLSLTIVAMGALRSKDSRSTAIDFINWLKEQNLNPSAQQGHLTKTEDIVGLLWNLDFSKYGSEHEVDFKFNANWNQPEKTYLGGGLYFHTNSDQYSVRINILPPMRVQSRSDYDGLAKKITSFAEEVHKKIKAKVTVVDKNSTALGSKAYNLHTLPLWIGWYSVYDPEMWSKHKITDKILTLNDLKIIDEEKIVIMHSTKGWSEYHRYGWNDETKNYLKSFGGRLLHNK